MPFQLNYNNGVTTYSLSFWFIKYEYRNRDGKTGGFTFFGYATSEDYDTLGDVAKIGEHRYDITDPEEYDLYLGKASYPQTEAYDSILEANALAHDNFFDAARQISFVRPLTAEVGSLGSDHVLVTFPAEIDHSGGSTFSDGVNIEINSVVSPILSVTRPIGTELVYVITDAVDPDDIVTWSYDYNTGGLEDASGLTVQSILPMSVSNTVGEYLMFNDKYNSGQLLTMGAI